MALFYDTVHQVNIRDYSQEQVAAWAPAEMDRDTWTKRLSQAFTYIAEEDGKIAGFGELEANGHIDRFYCHKDFQRKGVGTKLLVQIEQQARSLGLSKLVTEASITAKPFFEANGFFVVRQQEVERRGQRLTNFVMEKPLIGADS